MPKPDTKTEKPQPIVTLRIEPRPTSPAQRENWRRFWQKLIAEVKASERQ